MNARACKKLAVMVWGACKFRILLRRWVSSFRYSHSSLKSSGRQQRKLRVLLDNIDWMPGKQKSLQRFDVK